MTQWWRNGERLAVPTIALDAPLARFGDGVFETIRVDNRRARWLDAHLDRLLAGAQAHLLNGVPPRDTLAGWIGLAASQEERGALRVVLTPSVGEGNTDVLVGIAAQTGDAPSAVRLATVDVPHPGLTRLGKHTSWAWSRIALREARRQGADDALLVRDGVVIESATAAVVFERNARWMVCGEDAGALASTSVRALRQLMEVAPATAPVSALWDADAVVLLSSLRLATPVSHVDGAELPSSELAAAALRQRLLQVP